MQSPQITSGRFEKGASGWFRGCNSTRDPWILDDAMYVWSVNMVNRGGIMQTRPGYRLRLTLPSGNLQGCEIFYANKDDSTTGYYFVFSVDGKVYSQKFNADGSLTQPQNWELKQLANIQFDTATPSVIFCIAQQSVTQTSGNISVVTAHNVLMMQDGGISDAAYYDGTSNSMLDETQTGGYQTPKGSWMAYSGNRLWVGRDSALLASDLNDPLTFTERVSGTGRGDLRLPDAITGMINTVGPDLQANLVVFTAKSSFSFLSYVQDRTTWSTTVGFQTTLYPTLGCVSGLSPVNHAGLLWWYSARGLISSDSATAAFLSSRIKYRDVEMTRARRSFNSDLSTICSCSFESYLMISCPVNDTLNSQTMVMDYAIADELVASEQPAWNGVWTGTRPIKWMSTQIGTTTRCMFASIDYQVLDGSANHLWEAFQDNRMDTIQYTDQNGIQQVVNNPIGWSYEGKAHGDGLDLKKYVYAVLNMVECAGQVNIKVSYRGTRGGYKEVLSQKILAYIDNDGLNNSKMQALLDAGVVLVPQSRKLYTENAQPPAASAVGVEGDADERVDRCFSLLVQGCGRAGMEAYQIFMDPVQERYQGQASADESLLYVVTQDGTTIPLQ